MCGVTLPSSLDAELNKCGDGDAHTVEDVMKDTVSPLHGGETPTSRGLHPPYCFGCCAPEPARQGPARRGPSCSRSSASVTQGPGSKRRSAGISQVGGVSRFSSTIGLYPRRKTRWL